MNLLSIFTALSLAFPKALSSETTIKTTSGTLQGALQDGVLSFKGIPFGQPPVGSLRWEPPKPFLSVSTRNATTLGPSCIQQFAFATQNLTESLFNNPPPPESEDCLFLNVWAPSEQFDPEKPVVVWFYGGGLAFGTASIAGYDGTSFAKNQGIVIVTINYRTNVFGFPGAEELFPNKENLGYLDQELALQWVQLNIAAFGGDPKKVTIMGESAGALSVAQAIQRHPSNAPFRAGIMESGTATSMSPVPAGNFATFDALSKAVNCTQIPGKARLACMKAVPADVIRTWENGPQACRSGLLWTSSITEFSNPIQRIQQKKTARVPILIGANQDDGSLFTLGETSLPGFLNATFGPLVTADQVRAVYPGLNDAEIIPKALRDFAFVCPAEVATAAFVQSGISNVFRYIYGAVFADLQIFPGAGAWHSSEIGEIFGTFNASTATPAEVTLSHTMQKVWANFIKNPTTSPAPNWARYVPGNGTKSLAKLAYVGNVQLGDVVQPAPSALDDAPCDGLWNVLVSF